VAAFVGGMLVSYLLLSSFGPLQGRRGCTMRLDGKPATSVVKSGAKKQTPRARLPVKGSSKARPQVGVNGTASKGWPPLPTPKDCIMQPCSPCPLRPSNQTCKWTFVRYIPSDFEDRWWEELQTQDHVGRYPCEHIDKNYREAMDVYLKAIDDGYCTSDENLPEGGCLCSLNDKPVEFDSNVFSRFEYKNNCTSEVVHSYIEPLVGILRHPRYCAMKGLRRVHPMRRNWLVVDQWEMHKNRNRDSRFFYFDLGASAWNSNDSHFESSQVWFDSIYENKCGPFQGYWMWEVTQIEPEKVYETMPGRIRPNYHWYNIPADPRVGSFNNPLHHLRQVARPDDFVVFKLDIDTAPVEEAFVDELLADDELLGLVDEFFWEHHVKMFPIAYIWKKQVSGQKRPKDSVELFRRLRLAGVRAHSWI